MIKKEGDYYFMDNSKPPTTLTLTTEQIHQKTVIFEALGDFRERLRIIRQRFYKIKDSKQQLKQKESSQSGIISRSEVREVKNDEIHIEFETPSEIMGLDERLNKLMRIVKPNEVKRQKIERKGSLSDRIGSLLGQFAKIQLTSPEIIISNIQNYANYLDDREEILKTMFLYDCYNKTQGMSEQIAILHQYLQNLQLTQNQINSSISLPDLVISHNKLIQKRVQLSIKIESMFKQMSEQYNKMQKQIDQLSV